jgi:7,8-dihydroneopterin aldolase/epimerase/oxygenase
MADRIVLRAMAFQGHHGVTDEERDLPQLIEVDVEMTVDLRTAGQTDDLAETVDYGEVFERCRQIVEGRSFHLLEGIAEAIATELLAGFAAIESVLVRVRKPGVPIDGLLEYAGVEIERAR